MLRVSGKTILIYAVEGSMFDSVNLSKKSVVFLISKVDASTSAGEIRPGRGVKDQFSSDFTS